MKRKVLIPVAIIAAIAVMVALSCTSNAVQNLFTPSVPFNSKDNTSLVFNQEETLVATATRNEGVLLWTTAGTKPPVRLMESDLAKPLCFQPDGKTLLAVQNSNLVYWLPNGSKLTLGTHSPRPKRPELRAAAYSHDGDMIALLNGGKEKTLEIVSHFDTMTILELPGVEMFCWCQQDIIAVGYDSRVELWSVNGKTKLKQYSITGTKEDDKGNTRISGLCYSKLQQDLLCCNNRGDLFLFGTSNDERARKDSSDRPYTNIGPITHGSLQTWGTMPLHVGALTNKDVKAWRFYGGKLEPLTVEKEAFRSEFEYYATLSPSAKWTTIYRHSEGAGHVLWLSQIKVVTPADTK